MKIGLVRNGGELQRTQDVLQEAALFGQVDGYPLSVLSGMLSNRKIKTPTASQISGLAWRRTVLETIIDYYVKPHNVVPLLRGTLIHNGLENISLGIQQALKEVRLKSSLHMYKDIPMSGQIDVYYPQYMRLEDYKTAQKIPNTIKPAHMFQLAVYYWLLVDNGYEVQSSVIDYISWNSIKQLRTTVWENREINTMSHPLIADYSYFENKYYEAFSVLNEGFSNNIVPPTSMCNFAWCSYCPVRWACDIIPAEGGEIDPGDFVQEEI